MDIEALRCALALHAALYLKPRILARAVALLAHPQGIDGSRTGFTEAFATRYGTRADWQAADKALRWQDPNHLILTCVAPEYPANLGVLEDAPPILFIWGAPQLSQLPRLGIVGSRAATYAGREFAQALARDLAAAGFCIVSGLARGIDAAAHRGALEAGGVTFAVLGCGADCTYPKTHQRLAEEIVSSGALLSELPLGASPLRHHFPLRNRIIAGLCGGIIVVEASLSSGSLITARAALEQGREVLAVPGSIRNPLAHGCHALLKDGAHLVESAFDVLAALPRHACTAGAGSASPVTASEFPLTSRLERKVLDALGFEPTHMDALLARTGLTMPNLSSILLGLELSGAVRALTGGRFERVFPRSPQPAR